MYYSSSADGRGFRDTALGKIPYPVDPFSRLSENMTYKMQNRMYPQKAGRTADPDVRELCTKGQTVWRLGPGRKAAVRRQAELSREAWAETAAGVCLGEGPRLGEGAVAAGNQSLVEELQGTSAHQDREVDTEDAEEHPGKMDWNQDVRAAVEPETPQESDGHPEPEADMEQRLSVQSDGYREPHALHGVDALLGQLVHQRMVEAVSAD